MDQQKIGNFMKTLRKENNLTQEQLADKLLVSRRTVSRWETGNNLPDIELLIEIADLFNVDLRELINGERKNEIMKTEIKETAILAADYTNENNKVIVKTYHILFIVASIFGILSLVLELIEPTGAIWDFLRGVGEGMTMSTAILGAFYTSPKFAELMTAKKKCIG